MQAFLIAAFSSGHESKTEENGSQHEVKDMVSSAVRVVKLFCIGSGLFYLTLAVLGLTIGDSALGKAWQAGPMLLHTRKLAPIAEAPHNMCIRL